MKNNKGTPWAGGGVTIDDLRNSNANICYFLFFFIICPTAFWDFFKSLRVLVYQFYLCNSSANIVFFFVIFIRQNFKII